MEAEPAEEATNQKTIKIPCFIQKKKHWNIKIECQCFYCHREYRRDPWWGTSVTLNIEIVVRKVSHVGNL